MPTDVSTVAAVVADGLSARFPDGTGVGPVSFSLERGESMLVLGPSGSGKSTLLRLLQGAIPRIIEAPTTGTCSVAGRRTDHVEVSEFADILGVVAQDPSTSVCLPDVEDDVAFVLENLAVEPDRIAPRVAAALELAGAGHLAGRDSGRLSGGETQRVALAAATVTDPSVLLLDEPTSMLDADGVASVAAAVDAVARETGAACVLVEHRLDELADTDSATGLPERWLVLGDDGLVRYDGPSRDLSPTTALQLVRDGCWLPLDTELAAVTGHSGGLDNPAVCAALLADVEDRSSTDGSGTPPAGRPQVVPESTHLSGTLDVKGVQVRAGGMFGSRRTAPVLSDVDVEFTTGEIVALVGANGSGKTSLLHVLAGLSPPSQGLVDGPRAGLVFQNPEHQFAASTVRAEVCQGVPPERHDGATGWLDYFGLAQFADRNPYTLSGGQKRRLSLAAMMAHDRPFLLADEPGFGLDRRASVLAMRALRDIAHRHQRGVIFSSHDLRAVVTYADRVVVVGSGQVLADVEPHHLLQRPDVLEAARLRPPRLLRFLTDEIADAHRCREVLLALDAMVLPEPGESSANVHVPSERAS